MPAARRAGSGSRHLRSPVGGAANGTPRYARVPAPIVPINVPACVVTAVGSSDGAAGHPVGVPVSVGTVPSAAPASDAWDGE